MKFRKYFIVKKPVKDFKVGSIIPIFFNKKDDKPTTAYWRRRLEDAKTDGCLVPADRGDMNKKNKKKDDKKPVNEAGNIKEV